MYNRAQKKCLIEMILGYPVPYASQKDCLNETL